MRPFLLLLPGVIASVSPACGQDVSSIPDGRAARVWAEGSAIPITGRIDAATVTLLRLDVDDPYCGAAGCNRSFSINWPDVARLQVGRLSSTERAIRAAAVGVGLALLLGPGLNSCEGRGTERCEGVVFASAGAVGLAGYFFTRQSWEDVATPE